MNNKLLVFVISTVVAIAPAVNAQEFLFKWGSSGSSSGEFRSPQGIAVDPSGNIYVADSQNNRIQKFTGDGTFLAEWGSPGSGEGQFNSPYGVAIDSVGNVYVADQGNSRIQKFTSDGVFIAKWGFLGTGDGEFKRPHGVAIDSAGNIYVTDTQNHRIQKFTKGGAFITKWGIPGSGDATFQPPLTFGFQSPIHRVPGMAAADFNNDRMMDLVFANRIAFGNGDGTFQLPVDYVADSIPYPHSIVAADFNRDRAIDLATADGAILLGNGDGTFQLAIGYGTVAGPTSVIATDFNSDRVVDLAIGGSGAGILLGNGDGTFRPFLSLIDGPDGIPPSYSVAAADFNNDGAMDVAFVGHENGVAIFLGNGDGTFRSPFTFMNMPFYPFSSAAADFNKDGKIDLVISAFGETRFAILLGNGDGTFQQPLSRTASSGVNFIVVAADFSGDGEIDLATGGGGKVVRLYLGRGDGTFLPAAGWTTSSGFGVLGLVAADFNGDGKTDLVATSVDVGDILLADGPSQFNTPTSLATDSSNNVYVVERDNHRNQKFTSAGAFIARWGSFGSADSEFEYPRGVAVDSSGHVYVVDAGNNRIQMFTGTGFFLTKWGTLGTDDGQFNDPYSLVVSSSSNRIYILDRNNNRVQVFSKPVNTPQGSVVVQPVDATTGKTPVTLTFSNGTTAGYTDLATSSSGPPPPAQFKLGNPATYYLVTTTASFTGTISVCIDYTNVSFKNESALKLFHFEGGVWVDKTVSQDPLQNIICALVTSLSPFAIFESFGDITPPVIVPTVSPAPNAQGWNNTDVTVTWRVEDPESGIASSTGCSPTVLTTETSGTLFTCSATNGAGLSSSTSVTIKIDQTAPEAANQFDPTTGDVVVLGRDNLSGVPAGPIAPLSVVPTRWGRGDDDDDDDADERGNADLRTYLVQDAAGNTLRLVEVVKREGHELKATILSLQYNAGPVITPTRNTKAFEWGSRKTGSLKELEQKLTLGQGSTKQKVQAKYEAEKNRTMIKVKNLVQTKQVLPGLVLLRFVTSSGILRIEV